MEDLGCLRPLPAEAMHHPVQPSAEVVPSRRPLTRAPLVAGRIRVGAELTAAAMPGVGELVALLVETSLHYSWYLLRRTYLPTVPGR
jgi:hypothetical protein